ncbi:hypothetical protein HK097_003807 [Rhizophlyctis rosea]|uniref:Uncharacterized protein n=1 Tax=Rhizophlyctis rosea TaxID=64517 RepID=A0AAD5S276_9FUNG|nr:hypothetical protein HK097_003807 [Rhizophlyctis rosea]
MKTHIPGWEALEHVIDEGGLKLSILIRLAPYPYNLLNILFSATSITLSQYTLATSISLLKLLIYVYIGSTIADLALGDTKLTPARILLMSVGIIIGAGVLIYMTMAVHKVVARKAAEEAVGLTVGEGDFRDDDDLEEGGGGAEDLWNAENGVFDREQVSPSLFTNDFYFGDSTSRNGTPLADRGPS